jgi:hypothetical protein
MRVRLAIGAAFFVVALVMIWVSLRTGYGIEREDLLLNVGTEIAGIVITVVLVDLLLEKQRHREERKAIAWRALDEIDHAIWVWQGGARELDVTELSALIDNINDLDPIPEFTQNLLMRIGSASEATLRLRAEVLGRRSAVRAGLEATKGLAAMRDGDSVLRHTEIAEFLRLGVRHFAEAVGVQSSLELPVGSVSKNPSIAAQTWRHYGERLAGE